MMIKQLTTIILAGSLLLTGCARGTAVPQANLPQPPQRPTLVVAQVNQPGGRELAQLPQPGQRGERFQRLPGDTARQGGQALAAPSERAGLATLREYDAGPMLVS